MFRHLNFEKTDVARACAGETSIPVNAQKFELKRTRRPESRAVVMKKATGKEQAKYMPKKGKKLSQTIEPGRAFREENSRYET